MSEYQESCRLRLEEIAAVLSLAGRKNLVGFRAEQLLTREAVWNACCALLGDGLLTQTEGKFRISRELAEVMQPLCAPAAVLALTPGTDLAPQVLYYVSDRATALEQAVYGGYTLTPLGANEILQDLCDRLELEFPDYSQEDAQPPQAAVAPEDGTQKLLAGADFVLEQLDPETGHRRNWLRVLSVGMDRWLQWTQGPGLECEALTEELLQKVVQRLRKGETV